MAIPGWLLFAHITAIVVFCLLAIAVGLIENRILKSEECCGDDRGCLTSMAIEWNAYYNTWTGLRTRYIFFVITFLSAVFTRWKEFDTFPPSAVFLLYLIFLVTGALSADSATQSFGVGNSYTSPLPLCEPVSKSVLDLAEFCAWLSMIGVMVVFYIWSINLPSSQWWARGFSNPGYIDDMGYVKDMEALGVVEGEVNESSI